MSASASNNYPPCDDSATSQPSISNMYTTKRKNPYTPWYMVDGNHFRSTTSLYGPENETYFTLQVSHGGDLIDRPGQTYQKLTIIVFKAVNVKQMDLHELLLMSRHLGYSTIGKWYYIDEDPEASLEFLPLRTEDHLASFRERVQMHNFQKVEKVFVEHGEPSKFMFLPKVLMECGNRRIEKIVTLLLLSNHGATVEDGVERVHWMTGLRLSKEK